MNTKKTFLIILFFVLLSVLEISIIFNTVSFQMLFFNIFILAPLATCLFISPVIGVICLYIYLIKKTTWFEWLND